MTNTLKKLVENIERIKLGAVGSPQDFKPIFPESFGPFLISSNQKVYNLSQIYSANIFGVNHPLDFAPISEAKNKFNPGFYCYDRKDLNSLTIEQINIDALLNQNLENTNGIVNLTNIYGYQASAFTSNQAAIIELNQNIFVSNCDLNLKQNAHPIGRYFFEFFTKSHEITDKIHAFIKKQTTDWNVPHKLLGRFLFLELSIQKQENLFRAGVLGQNRQMKNYNIYFSFPYCMKPAEIVEAIRLINENC